MQHWGALSNRSAQVPVKFTGRYTGEAAFGH
jgi:hypothetical protein